MIADPRIGTVLAGYRIESVLGRGGMSVVYLAEHIGLKRKAALKLLSPELAQDERFRERFIRESQTAAALDHPNIIPIYEAGEAEGVLYIAMRFVRGTDLKSLIRAEGPLDPARAIPIIAQAGEALDAAHREGLVHRDVKPGNILITPGPTPTSPGHVYLSDFGITKRTSSDSGLTGTGQFVGTLDYAAPEQVEGRPLDGRTDVYSLACVLFECLTGEVPFVRDAEMAVLWAHVHEPPPRLTERRPDLPSAIDGVIAKGMAKPQDQRYGTSEEFVGAARETLGIETGERPAIVRPAPGALAVLGRRRWILAAALGAGILGVIIGVIILFAVKGGQAPGAQPTTAAGPPIIHHGVLFMNSQGVILDRIAVGNAPSGVATGEGSVWITDTSDDAVYRIDSVTRRVVAKVPVPSVGSFIAVGEGSTWVSTENNQNSVVRIDTTTNKVVKVINVEAAGGGGCCGDVVVGGGDVWVTAEKGVFRIDPVTNEVMGPTLKPAAGKFITGLAYEAGALWVASPENAVYRIDPATGNAIGTVRRADADFIVVDDRTGTVWTAVGADVTSNVLEIDPTQNKVVARIDLAGVVQQMDARGGVVWVTSDIGTLYRIRAFTGDIERRIDVGKSPSGIAIGEGGVWAAFNLP